MFNEENSVRTRSGAKVSARWVFNIKIEVEG
jgi:hypothetical protein